MAFDPHRAWASNMIGLDPDAEARELRALVALLEKERSELVGQLDEYEDELNRERHHSLALDDELSRLRNKEMLISSPIVNIDENEVELLRQKVDEAGVVIKDLEARLALAEEGEQHLMNVMDENERAHSSKLSALASKLATLEMENNRLRSENELMSPRDQSTALLEAKAAEAERARKTVEDDLLHLQAELAELKMQTELDAGDSPSARPLDPFGTLSDRRAHDPEIHGALEEFDVDQLLPLKEQYRSRIRHFTALEKDVDRVLHVRDPVKYPHPDKKAEKPAEPEKTDNDEDEGDYLDAQWLELAHWMRGRFGQRTSLKELKRYISRFTPKKLRAPTGDDASYDSPRSTDGRQGKWRQDACSQGESTLSYLSERELFERVLSEARRKGRSLYMSDRSQHSTSSPSI